MKSVASIAFLGLFALFGALQFPKNGSAAELSGKDRVRAAIEYMRDNTSYSAAEMTVHRPGWERRSTLRAWTKGLHRTLVRFIAPAKDAGNASLTLDEEMWSFNPKTNRIIRIPPSMKSQNWMGSDFSYQDLSKGDDIIEEYEHTQTGVEQSGEHTVYIITSIPKDSAPVVWGKEVLKIRDDSIVLEHEFYDQEMKLIKKLTGSEIKQIGGKLYATLLHMENMEKPDEWTEVRTLEANFGATLEDQVFTQPSLSNPQISEASIPKTQ